EGSGGFARAREAGEPDRRPFLFEQRLARLARDVSLVPGDVRRLRLTHPNRSNGRSRCNSVNVGVGEWGVCASTLPELAVEAAVADGLDDVGGPDVGLALQIGDGTRHAQDAVVRPC